MPHIVFTGKALETILRYEAASSWLNPSGSDLPIECDVVRIATMDSLHFIHRSDLISERRIVIMADSVDLLQQFASAATESALRRAHRAALAAQNLPLRLPFDWAEYHSGNLVTFFACGKSHGAYRWVAQLRPFNTDDVCYWLLTNEANAILLEEFVPTESQFDAAVRGWSDVFATATARFDATPAPIRYVPLDGAIDLEAVTFGAVVGHRTYSAWLRELTPDQKTFVTRPTQHAVKLRGPAGSGKTLSLAMKALQEVYGARRDGKRHRILFATHSWAMAEQVDKMLGVIDESGCYDEITLFPLVEIAKSILPNSTFSRGLSLLGQDSYSGQREQLKRIDAAVWWMRQGDWLAYEGAVSPDFRRRVLAERGSPPWNSLLWDIMHEFASVLSAAKILPGITAEKRYLALQRADWMMPMNTDAEKRFVLQVYTEYVAKLREESLLSVDQLFNDLLNYLETFTWNYRRVEEGYDLIFVDEWHLFTETERQIFNYLTRNPAQFPRILMTLDPRQSPSEVYADFPLEAVASAESGIAESGLGNYDALDLTRIHRFSPQILSVVQFIQHSYPTLGLGQDWMLDTDKLYSSAANGEIPLLRHYASPALEIGGVVASAKTRFSQGAARRMAIVLLDDARLPEYQNALEMAGLPIVTIKGRDDVDSLRYQKRSIVLTAAEYAAGLQFNDVIVSSLPDLGNSEHLPVHQRRRVLSTLYLAISRASDTVELHVCIPPGELSAMLDQAANSGLFRTS